MAHKIDVYEENTLFQRSQVDLGRIEKNKSKGARSYAFLLIAGKCLHAFGIFVCYGILKNISLIQFLFLAKVSASIMCVLLQRPFTTGKRVSRTQWRAIIFSSACNVIITLLWLDALTICGPLRTILLYQHCDIVILSSVGILFQKGAGLKSKIRGASFFLLGLLFLLFFDHDEEHIHKHHPEGEHKSATLHHLYHFFTWLGLPDHKGGIFILLLASIGRVFYNSYCKNLALDVGGAKRLNCLINLTETMMLTPWLITGLIFKDQTIDVSNFAPIFVVALLVFVIDFYVESIASARLDSHSSLSMGSITSFIVALAIALYWEHVPFTVLKPYEMQKHGIAAGAMFAALCFIVATRILTRPIPVKPGTTKGMLIGFSKGGLPLYSFAGPGGTIPQAPMTVLKQYLRVILEAPDSRNIFFYLCLNLTFTGVELVYGVWTNSLGLISDGFHMLFDCSALVLGLAASVMSRWKATKVFSFGFGRLEILSGFVNGLFLVVIAFFVFTAALQRLVDPPRVNTDKLLAVSVAGLFVNMIGIFAFSHAHAHSHGGAKCESAKHDGHFGHSHDSAQHHGHSHDNNHHNTSKSSKGTTNMQGVFLHVVADTLGSVGVIISSLLIQQYDLYIADPICSLFIAVMIFISVLPLLKQSSHVLLLKTPHDLKASVHEALKKDQTIDVSNFAPIFVVALLVFVIDFYIESIASARLDSNTSLSMGSITSFIVALAIALYWEHVPFTALKPYEMQKHGIAAGAMFAALCFIVATRILTRPIPVKPGTTKGMLIGFSKGGLPLYSFAGPGGTIPQAPMTVLKQYLRVILEAPDSRNIFFYLCLNLTFTGVELVYGVWTNSLGLISDGFHMLFDCSALVLGLAASVMSRWKATKVFSFGFGRLEILSGFVNGLFLVVIAFFVFTAALQRLVDPPRVNTDKLLAVSVAGLFVNMIGIFAFSHAHAHSHGGAKCESAKHDGHFGHSHDSAQHHGHSHDNNHHNTSKSSKGTTNMQGVFLHVVADTLGSVGVIISSLLIQQYDLYIADPICSLFIAVMIFISVLPLLKQSSHVLLLKTPHDLKASVHEALKKVLNVPDVLSYKDQHVWGQSADSIVGTIHIQVVPNAIEKRILQQVTSIFKEHGFGNMTVQIEKESYYHSLNKLSGGQFHSVNFPIERTINNSSKGNYSIKSI